MNNYSIIKMLFITFFMFGTQATVKNPLISEYEKMQYEEKIKKVDMEAKKNQDNKIVPVTKIIFVVGFTVAIYKFLVEQLKNDSAEKPNFEETKKTKNILQTLESKIGESNFGAWFTTLYNELFFTSDISSILNDSKMTTECKDLLKTHLQLAQAESSAFGDTLVFFLGYQKMVETLKKGFYHAINMSLPVLAMIGASSTGHWYLAKKVKSSIKDRAAKIDYLSQRPLTKDSIVILGTVIIELIALKPLFNILCMNGIQAVKEWYSDSHSNSKESEELKKNREVYEGGKAAIKSAENLYKIGQYFYKIITI